MTSLLILSTSVFVFERLGLVSKRLKPSEPVSNCQKILRGQDSRYFALVTFVTGLLGEDSEACFVWPLLPMFS